KRMPCLMIHTNVEIADKPAFLMRCSSETAAALGKPESYVMVKVNDMQVMLFAGTDAPLAFVELKSLGLTTAQTADISATLCDLLQQELGIDAGRVYIEFAAPERAMFGWNGGTF
ncbi:MAG: phenylpyruvate tautomerase MIF-related protein, partial [Mariprofundus sp.]